MNALRRATDRLLAFVRLDSGTGIPHINRWRFWRTANDRTGYLHHIVDSDRARHMHDHPKPFWSIGLWGGYIEELPGDIEKHWRAPWVRKFPASHIHRLRVEGKGAWTFVITGRRTRRWGFWIPDEGRHLSDVGPGRGGRWVPWQEYINDGATAAAEAEANPRNGSCRANAPARRDA